MSAKIKKTAPVTIADEHNEVKIYTVKSRAGTIYQISYYRAGERIRKTFADMNEARREARMQLGQLAGERIQARVLSATEMESYMLAMRTLEPTGVPLHVCTELFAECARALKGRSIVEATKYYLQNYDPERPRKPLRDLTLEFVESRRSLGGSEKYLTASRSVMRILLRAYAGRSLDDIDSKGLDEMLQGLKNLKNRSRNSYRIILVCFGNFLKKRGYLPEGKSTPFENIMHWRNEIDPVSIYTPEDMQVLITKAHLGILPYKRTPTARLSLTPRQTSLIAGQIEASRELVACFDCGLVCVVGQVDYRGKKPGKIAAHLAVRAIPRNTFDGICAILKDC